MARTVVYYVDSAVFGGTEQTLLHLLAGLDRQRWEPVLFHHAEPGIAPLLEGADKLNVKTRVMPRMEGMHTASGLPRFLQHLRIERPAVFHAQLSWLLSCKYGNVAATLARVPVVIATAQQYMEPPWGRTVFLQQQFISKCVDRYVAVSQAVAWQLCHTFHVSTGKVRVIHNSVPTGLYNRPSNSALRKALTSGEERPIVLTVARLDRQKGHTYLLEAISQIQEAVFVLVGDGPERATLQIRASELGISERVIFLGYRSDIPDLMASCDLFVLPSIYEGFPLTILEAMAAGRPVVATAVGGTPEAVLDGETGYLVPPSDATALAAAIRLMLKDPVSARKMGAAGKVRVEREYSSAIMVERITETYEELLDRH